MSVSGSCTAEVEFEFTTWAWVQATAETAFGSGLVVRSPGSVKALNQSTHNSLGHCRNVHSAVAGHGRMNFRPWPATAEWTFRQWPRELWVDWFNALTEPGDRTTRPLPNAVSAVAWTQAQVVNSNSTSRVKETRLSHFYRRKGSCGKVMFSQVSFCLRRRGGHAWWWGGGHVWQGTCGWGVYGWGHARSPPPPRMVGMLTCYVITLSFYQSDMDNLTIQQSFYI